MRTIERHLQQCINRIENWASHNGFKFSKSKTQCVHFCQLRKVHNDPELYLYGSFIPVVEDFKFLGVLFDRKLAFIPHIKYLKALNLLKVLSHTDWGADRTVLRQLYRSLIRSKLDYGSIVYGSARPLYISSLDTVHHQGLRLALVLFEHHLYKASMLRLRSHLYIYDERNLPYSTPLELLLIHQIQFIRCLFRHIFLKKSYSFTK